MISNNILKLGRTKIGRIIVGNKYLTSLSAKIWSKIYNYENNAKYKQYPLIVNKSIKGKVSRFIVENPIREYFTLHDYEENAFLNQIISVSSEHKCYYDIGASVGLTSIPLSPFFNKVFALEPNPNAIKILNRHIKLNEIRNIEVLNVGLSDITGGGILYLDEKGSYNSLGSIFSFSEKFKIKEKIRLFRLDELVETNKMPPPAVVKIDIEGAELKALIGMKNILSKIKPILFIELHPSHIENLGGSQKELFHLLKNYNYKIKNLRLRRRTGYKIIAKPN